MLTCRQIDLVLLLSERVPLQSWAQKGMLERELALYRAMQPHLRSITLLSDGNRHELDFRPQVPGMHILCNRWGLRPWHYQRWLKMPWRGWQRGHVLFKSNQLSSALLGLSLANHFKQKSITRCGYLLSEFAALHHGAASLARVRAFSREHRAFHGAHRAVVTTPHMHSLLQQRYGIDPQKIFVQPNYVDCDLFQPAPRVQQNATTQRLLLVGRLHPEKNILALLQAMIGLPKLHLDLIGQGEQLETLQQFVAQQALSVTFHGALPHRALVDFYQQCDLFVLPSLQEGHPKALLEAMACGAPVLASDAPGNRDVVMHGNNGWLCQTDSASIRHALQQLLPNQAQRQSLGQQARHYALQEVSLPVIAAREMALYEAIFNDSQRP
ncbi:glycosyltransferase family 4 protein [Magnetococcus marinus]|nr:glycosyltransferase family 4 protein [Magnetococcus marinus]